MNTQQVETVPLVKSERPQHRPVKNIQYRQAEGKLD